MIKNKNSAVAKPVSTGFSLSRLFGNGNGHSKSALTKSSSALLGSLEGLQTNVLFADKDFNLVYANQKSLSTLNEIEDEIEKAFGISADEIVGGSIHRFHKDSRKIEKILRNPSALPHDAEFSLGSITFKTTINAAFDAHGQTIGYVVNWENVAVTKKTEAEMARVMSMMENAPVNVMFADLDFKIRYINPASVKTLKSIEQYLPVKTDFILGQSIDIFHKNPERQRKLLSNPGNLPHQTQIQLGPETLDLQVSAIYDNNKNYMGPMVTWEVVTQKLELEKRDKEMNANMRKILEDVTHNAQSLAGAAGQLTGVSRQMAGNAEATAELSRMASEPRKIVGRFNKS